MLSHKALNFAIGTAGLVSMLLGLLFLQFPMFAIPLTGIGGSVLATALVNWILTRRMERIPVTSIVESLVRATQFMRINHEVELIFRVEDDMVRLDKRHRYSLRNPGRYIRPHLVSIFDDLPAVHSSRRGGFQVVVEPGNNTLDGEALKNYVREERGKYVFNKTYNLQPGDANDFEFRSYAYYRLADRLIWTVQELADNFRVRIINQTGNAKAFDIKVNHHREASINEQLRDLGQNHELLIDFNAEVLPYQGFEVMWDLGRH
jgi:hypothetical protein